MNVYIGFSTSDALISRIIRWFTDSEVSHTFIVYDDATLGRKMVLEADWDGYHIRSFEEAVKGDTGVILVMPAHPVDGLLEVCSTWLGRPYDYPGIVGMVWNIAGRVLRKKWRNPIQDTKALFCSEAIAIALQRIGYPGASRLIPENTTPQDLLDFLTK